MCDDNIFMLMDDDDDDDSVDDIISCVSGAVAPPVSIFPTLPLSGT